MSCKAGDIHTGHSSGASYEALLNSIHFTTTSDSLEARTISTSIQTTAGNSEPNITTISITEKPDVGNSGDDVSPIVGSDGNDLLHGTDDSDIIRGLAGDDEIFGSAEEDQIAGGDGIDTSTFEDLDGAANRIVDLTLNTSGGDSHDIINLAKLLQENSQADFIELHERVDQYVRMIRGDSGDYGTQVDFDGIRDDQIWLNSSNCRS